MTSTAWAQERPDAGRILQEQTKERAPLPSREAPRVLPRVEDRPAQKLPPTLSLRVDGFRVTGNTVFTERELLAQLKEFSGKELDVDGLLTAADKLKSFYRQSGYFLAQAYLPRQELRAGAGNTVEISVIEGRIGKTSAIVAPDSHILPSVIENILSAELKPGTVITERGLERPLLLASDLPGVSVRSEIKPGSQIGLADVTAKVEGKEGNRVNGSIDFDNHGSRFIGQHRLGGSISVNNPLNLGDQLSARVIGSEERFWFLRGAYAVPVGPYGTRIGFAYSEFDYVLTNSVAFDGLGINGQGKVNTLYGFHPVIRSRGVNIILQGAIDDKKLTDKLPAREDHRIFAYKFGVVGDWRDTVLGGGLNSFSVVYTDGTHEIGPAVALAADQGATGLRTQGKFSKWNYDFRRLQKIDNQTTFLFSAQGQLANKNLASAERFSLGGPTGVRAYPASEASGNEGHILSGEIRYLVPNFTSLLPGDATFSAFYDWGWTKIDDTPQTNPARNSRSIAGMGLGLSLGRSSDYVIQASMAWRTESELPTADGAQRRPRFWVQGIKWF